MKRCMFIFFLLAGCVSAEELLNQEYSNKQIYLCQYYDGIAPGHKTIKKIDISEHYRAYTIDLLNDKGEEEQLTLDIESSNYVTDIKDQLSYKPFCSRTEYERQLEARRNAEKRKKENLEDCEQAINRAQQRRNELNKLGELFVLDKTKTLNPSNHTSNWSHCLKVIDYSKDGILVKSNCTSSPIANALLSVFVGCEDKEYFIYTADNYADGECYKDWEYLHRDFGVYNWSGKRIRAFRKTNFKISEIEYHMYLKDKSLKCCVNNGKISVCEQ